MAAIGALVTLCECIGGRISLYREQAVNRTSPAIWLDDLKVGLGIWEGEFEGIPSHWLRWYDAQGGWLLTDTEQAEQARQDAQRQVNAAQQRANRLAQRLRELGVDPDEI